MEQSQFDEALGKMSGLPNTTETKPSTIQTLPENTLGLGSVITCIVRTVRRTEDGRSRDYIFLQHIVGNTCVPLVIPPEVADTIARQRDSLGTMNRRKAGRARAEADKAAGVVPGFMRTKRKARS